jgi:hypothetical protein
VSTEARWCRPRGGGLTERLDRMEYFSADTKPLGSLTVVLGLLLGIAASLANARALFFDLRTSFFLSFVTPLPNIYFACRIWTLGRYHVVILYCWLALLTLLLSPSVVAK